MALFDEDKTESAVEVKIDKEKGEFVIGTKVFKSVESLVESKVKADEHINRLEAESKEREKRFQELESKLSQRTTVDKRMEDLEAALQKRVSGAEVQERQVVPEQRSQGLDQDGITKLIETTTNNILNQVQAKQTLEKNTDAIRNKLLELCGSEAVAKEAYIKYTKSADFDKDIYAQQLLRTPDKVVKDILEFADVPKTTTLGLSPRNLTPSINRNAQPIRRRSEDAKLMRENPRQYEETNYQIKLAADVRQMKADGTFQKYLAS